MGGTSLATEVRTQGRADYSMQFDSYAEVPPSIAKEIIAKARGE